LVDREDLRDPVELLAGNRERVLSKVALGGFDCGHALFSLGEEKVPQTSGV
jgi:hypothetical protein